MVKPSEIRSVLRLYFPLPYSLDQAEPPQTAPRPQEGKGRLPKPLFSPEGYETITGGGAELKQNTVKRRQEYGSPPS
jgi:hypothetical protein